MQKNNIKDQPGSMNLIKQMILKKLTNKAKKINKQR